MHRHARCRARASGRDHPRNHLPRSPRNSARIPAPEWAGDLAVLKHDNVIPSVSEGPGWGAARIDRRRAAQPPRPLANARGDSARATLETVNPMRPATTPEASAVRRRVFFVFASQGVAGLAVMLWTTAILHTRTLAILNKLGPDAAILIGVFVAFATTLALLKFELTDVIFVSLAMMAYMAMFPLLGAVMTSWLVVLIAIVTRLLAMRQIGPVKISMQDPAIEYVKTFGLFGTYGIPVIVATYVYQLIGGEVP